MTNSTKRCYRCQCEYPATTEFFYHRSNGALINECKQCHKTDHRQRMNQIQRPDTSVHNGLKRCTGCNQWFPATREYFRIQPGAGKGSNLTAKCKFCLSLYDKKRYQDNREVILNELQETYSERREANLKRAKTWYYNNPEKVKKYRHNRRALMRELVADFTVEEWRQALEYFDYKCAVCGQSNGLWIMIVRDHWIPLNKGGGTTATNIIPLCHAKPGIPAGQPGCNNSKRDHMPKYWLIRRFGKRKTTKILKRIQEYFKFVEAMKND